MAAFQLLVLNVLMCIMLVATAPDGIIKRQAFRAVTTTVAVTSTSLTTITTSTSVVCAQFVNVTGACRRRKDLSNEEPTVLIFEEGFDDEINDYFSPTAQDEMENTPVPLLLDLGPAGVDTNLIQSSIEQMEPPEGRMETSRIYFSQINSFFNNIFGASLVTVTVTDTTTSTSTITDTSTATFFIEGCTPTPFSFTQCAVTRQR